MKSLVRLCAVALFGAFCVSLYGCNGQGESKTIPTPAGDAPSGSTAKPGDGKKAVMQPPGP